MPLSPPKQSKWALGVGVELLFLLLPLAAYSGWRIGRKGVAKQFDSERNSFSENYYKGLNYLLNEEQDKALDIFIKMVAVDSDTVETHIALGNLFRRRGEVDRAIRVHQNLIARPALSKEQRHQALYELAEDYLKAGLLDRAEGLYEDLVRERAEYIPSLKRLKSIYQQEKEWDKALAIVQRLGSVSDEKLNHIIAHYYCEKAELAKQSSDYPQALKWVKKAMQSDNQSVRANLLEGELESHLGNYKRAAKTYRRMLSLDLTLFSVALESMGVCFSRLGKSQELLEIFREVLRRHYSSEVMLHTTYLIQELQGEGAAVAFVSTQLEQQPSLEGITYLLDHTANMTATEVVKSVKDNINRLVISKPVYQCNQCGYSAKALFWHCPSCHGWNTVTTI